jgi:hypothetical protein
MLACEWQGHSHACRVVGPRASGGVLEPAKALVATNIRSAALAGGMYRPMLCRLRGGKHSRSPPCERSSPYSLLTAASQG